MTWSLGVLCIRWRRTIAIIITVVVCIHIVVIINVCCLTILLIVTNTLCYLLSVRVFLNFLEWIVVNYEFFNESIRCSSKRNKSITLESIAIVSVLLSIEWIFTVAWKPTNITQITSWKNGGPIIGTWFPIYLLSKVTIDAWIFFRYIVKHLLLIVFWWR